MPHGAGRIPGVGRKSAPSGRPTSAPGSSATKGAAFRTALSRHSDAHFLVHWPIAAKRTCGTCCPSAAEAIAYSTKASSQSAWTTGARAVRTSPRPAAARVSSPPPDGPEPRRRTGRTPGRSGHPDRRQRVDAGLGTASRWTCAPSWSACGGPHRALRRRWRGKGVRRGRPKPSSSLTGPSVPRVVLQRDIRWAEATCPSLHRLLPLSSTTSRLPARLTRHDHEVSRVEVHGDTILIDSHDVVNSPDACLAANPQFVVSLGICP